MGKFSNLVYACPECQERLTATRAAMKRTNCVYHCSKRHPVTWQTVWTFDSEKEFTTYHEFKLDKDKKNLRYHEKFQIQPDRWERLSDKKTHISINAKDFYFQDWYIQCTDFTVFRPVDEKNWIKILAEFYVSDITFEDKAGFHVVEVKKLNKKTGRPYFPGNESEKKLARIAGYLKMWYGLDLEVYTGRWWDFHNGRLVERGLK